MNNINGCPYKASNNGSCTHKGCKPNKGGKRMCGYKYPHNCDLFRDWLTIKQSISRMAKNSSNTHLDQEMQ